MTRVLNSLFLGGGPVTAVVTRQKFMLLTYDIVETSYLVEAYRERCEDCLDVIADGDRALIIVADGAGGTGDGRILTI